MPMTSVDLVREIAERLGEAGDGNPLSPEAAQKIRNGLPGIVADLEERDVGTFPSLEHVPPAAFNHLADIAASALSSKFGLSTDEVVALASRAQGAEGKLRQHRSLPYSGAPVPACYF